MTRQTIACALGAAGLLLAQVATAAAPPAPARAVSGNAEPADARFAAIHQAEWQWRIKEGLARDEAERGQVEPGFARVDAASQAARLAYWQGVLRRLDAIDSARLSAPARIDYQVYRAQIAAFVDELRFREYEQPVNADSAFWTDVTYAARQPFVKREDYVHYLGQLAAMPRYFAEQLENMRAGLARGFTPPRVTLAGRDAALASVAEA